MEVCEHRSFAEWLFQKPHDAAMLQGGPKERHKVQ